MAPETTIDSVERDSIYNILIAIQQRWQNSPQTELSANSDLADCAVDSSGDSVPCEATMAETMILQRPDFIPTKIESNEVEPPLDEMNETVIFAPSSSPSAPILDPDHLEAADDSIPTKDFVDVANDSSVLEAPDDGDPLAKTQILSRFSSEKVESITPKLSENSFSDDDNFASTVILSSAVNSSPKARSIIGSPEVLQDDADSFAATVILNPAVASSRPSQSILSSPEALQNGDVDLTKTSILQPFTGVANNPPVVDDKTSAPKVADSMTTDNSSSNSLLETVIIPSNMGKPN